MCTSTCRRWILVGYWINVHFTETRELTTILSCVCNQLAPWTHELCTLVRYVLIDVFSRSYSQTCSVLDICRVTRQLEPNTVFRCLHVLLEDAGAVHRQRERVASSDGADEDARDVDKEVGVVLEQLLQVGQAEHKRAERRRPLEAGRCGRSTITTSPTKYGISASVPPRPHAGIDANVLPKRPSVMPAWQIEGARLPGTSTPPTHASAGSFLAR